MEAQEEKFDIRPEVRRGAPNKLPINPEPSRSLQGRFPSWLHRKLPSGGDLAKTGQLLKKFGLNTVCEQAKCPNRFECYAKGTATFLALGKECTRNCGFCDIDFSKTPKAPEEDEPERIALSALELKLKHVVITMVARDDLADGGAGHIVKIIEAVRRTSQDTTIEVLTSDFDGNEHALNLVLQARPEVFNHNIETSRELTPRVRHKARYDRTLAVLRQAKESGLCRHVKSGMMLGLGETADMVERTLKDLYDAGCDIVTLGQYLQADRRKLIVKEFITPEQFKRYEDMGHNLGIKYVYAGPFVRSSYNAHAIQKAAESKL